MPGTVVLTGATGGLGRRFAHALASAQPNLHFILLCRKPSSVPPGTLPAQASNVEYRQLDMSHLSEVRSVSQQIVTDVQEGKIPPITLFVQNAGVELVDPDLHYTADGYEEMVAVNHLAHYGMTRELIAGDALDSKDSRIVVLGSSTAYPEYKFFKWPATYKPLEQLLHPGKPKELSENPYEYGLHIYGTSKLLQMMFANELADRLRDSHLGVTVLIYYPGVVGGTDLFRGYPDEVRTRIEGLINNPEEGRKTVPDMDIMGPDEATAIMLGVATSDEYASKSPIDIGEQKGGARYIGHDGKQVPTQGACNEPAKLRELWADSAQVLGSSVDL